MVREPELEVERSSRLSATSLSGFGPSRGEPKSHRGRTEPLVRGRVGVGVGVGVGLRWVRVLVRIRVKVRVRVATG